jgi:hypothetical protein
VAPRVIARRAVLQLHATQSVIGFTPPREVACYR